MPEDEAVVFRGEREVAFEARSRPEPDAGEVLIETERTLISTGTELALLTGRYQPEPDPFPTSPGYSNVGTVVEAGEGVDRDLVGERVASWSPHRRYVTADADACRVVPDGVAPEAAAFFALGEVAMHGTRQGDLAWGETAAVYGAGLVGQLTARVCRHAGAHRVFAIDRAGGRLDHLPGGPGVVPIEGDAGDAAGRIEAATGGRLADVAFEATGNAAAIPAEFAGLREQGRFVVLSSPRETTEFDFYADCHRPGYHIVGAHQRTHPPAETPRTPWTHGRHAELFLDLVAEGRLDVGSLVTHREPADEAPRLYELLLEDRTRALGVVLAW